MQFDRNKLRTVILYACSKCEPAKLGAVKLHKVLYYADMLQYAFANSPITGSTYRKRPLGPTCDQLLPMLRDLQRAGTIEVREVEYFGYRKKEFIAKEHPDLARLSNDEVALLDEVIEFVCNENTAKTISEYSHNAAWEIAAFGEELPYNSVYHIFPTQVSLEAFEWGAEQVADIEAYKRSRGGTLEGRSLRDVLRGIREAG